MSDEKLKQFRKPEFLKTLNDSTFSLFGVRTVNKKQEALEDILFRCLNGIKSPKWKPQKSKNQSVSENILKMFETAIQLISMVTQKTVREELLLDYAKYLVSNDSISDDFKVKIFLKFIDESLTPSGPNMELMEVFLKYLLENELTSALTKNIVSLLLNSEVESKSVFNSLEAFFFASRLAEINDENTEIVQSFRLKYLQTIVEQKEPSIQLKSPQITQKMTQIFTDLMKAQISKEKSFKFQNDKVLKKLIEIDSLSEETKEQFVLCLEFLDVLSKYDSKEYFAFKERIDFDKFLLSGFYNEEELVKKLEMFSIRSLVEKDGFCSYYDIKKKFNLESDEEVERFVIGVVLKGALDAKLNQPKRTLIASSLHGSLGTESEIKKVVECRRICEELGELNCALRNVCR